MPKETPQFFREGLSGRPASSRAIYLIPARSKNGKPAQIVVECVDGGGNVPRNATSFRKLAKNLDLEEEFKSVAAVAECVLNSLKAAKPDALEIEFGVELGGNMGIPLVTQGEAKANFKVTLKWGKS